MPSYDPLGLLIAAGRIHKWNSDIKFGHNEAVGTGQEAIWAQGGSPLVNNTATVVEFTSGDGEDHSASSGARTIEFSGVDANFEQQTETISMAGAVAASSVGSFLYVYRMKVLTAGSSLGNTGVISATLGTGASTFGTIPSGSGQSEMIVRPVPASATMYLGGMGVAVDKGADVHLHIQEYDQVNGVWRTKLHLNAYEATVPIRFQPPYVFPANHVIWLTAHTSNAAGFEVGAWWDYVISQGDT